MALLGSIGAARDAARAAARLTVAGAVLASVPAVATVGLLAEPTRAAARLARYAADGALSVAGGSLSLAKAAAESGTRAVGTVLTGSDPIPDGHVRSVVDVARGMLEPPLARHTRRVWAERGHVHIELAAPSVEEQLEVRRAIRRHLERLEGVEWATGRTTSTRGASCACTR